jgi:hypothetical protein
VHQRLLAGQFYVKPNLSYQASCKLLKLTCVHGHSSPRGHTFFCRHKHQSGATCEPWPWPCGAPLPAQVYICLPRLCRPATWAPNYGKKQAACTWALLALHAHELLCMLQARTARASGHITAWYLLGGRRRAFSPSCAYTHFSQSCDVRIGQVATCTGNNGATSGAHRGGSGQSPSGLNT